MLLFCCNIRYVVLAKRSQQRTLTTKLQSAVYLDTIAGLCVIRLVVAGEGMVSKVTMKSKVTGFFQYLFLKNVHRLSMEVSGQKKFVPSLQLVRMQ